MKMRELHLVFHYPIKDATKLLTELSVSLGGYWIPVDSSHVILYARYDSPFMDLIDGLVKLSVNYGSGKSWMYIGQKGNDPGAFHIGIDEVERQQNRRRISYFDEVKS